MSYKVIAFDLDGTLLNSQGQILPSSKKAIAQAIAQGIKVVLVTGRHHTAARPYYHELQLDTPMICCNGTYLYQPHNDEVLAANPLNNAQAEQVIAMAQQHNLHLLMYSRDAMNFLEINDHMRKFRDWVAGCPEFVRPQLRQVTDFHHLLNEKETIWKFVISHPDSELMSQAIATLPADQFSCEWSWVDRVDISSYGNTKGKRLLELLSHWQIDPQQVIAFGDNHNDISMLSAVGLGVAMGNGEAEVKQIAKRITLDNNQDGIATLLQALL